MNSPVTLLDAVTSTGDGTVAKSIEVALASVPLGVMSSNFVYSVVVNYITAAPTAATIVLQGSLDNLVWIDLGNTTDVSASQVALFVTNKPFIYIRGNLTAYTAGSCTGVTVKCGVVI